MAAGWKDPVNSSLTGFRKGVLVKKGFAMRVEVVYRGRGGRGLLFQEHPETLDSLDSLDSLAL